MVARPIRRSRPIRRLNELVPFSLPRADLEQVLTPPEAGGRDASLRAGSGGPCRPLGRGPGRGIRNISRSALPGWARPRSWASKLIRRRFGWPVPTHALPVLKCRFVVGDVTRSTTTLIRSS